MSSFLHLLLFLFFIPLFQTLDLQLKITEELVTLQNSYLKLQFNLRQPQLDYLAADFTGKGFYGPNLFAGRSDPLNRRGLVLERESSTNNRRVVFSSSSGASSSLTVQTLVNDTSLISVRVSNIVDSVSDSVLTSSWTLSLSKNERFFNLSTSTRVLASSSSVTSIRLSSYLNPVSLTAFSSRGSLQLAYPNNPTYFGFSAPVERIFALGSGAGCVDARITIPREIVGLVGTSSGLFNSGWQVVLDGQFPTKDVWNSDGWNNAKTFTTSAGTEYTATMTISPNNFDFPAGNVSEALDLPIEHVQAIYTGVYASPAGALVSYLLPGQISPTIAHPQHAYQDLYNFYDPDSWLSISSFMYSGDAYLFNEARKLLERSAGSMLPSGQIPHHFDVLNPIYTAISGATQTGPNIFWTSAALQYIKNSGDYDWLRRFYPPIRKSFDYLLNMYHPNVGLLNAPGPLWIDVFIRGNYSSDSNAFMVQLFRWGSELETFLGDTTRANYLNGIADKITEEMNRLLWRTDHYITQLNPDMTIKDMVDYDSNLLAIAFQIPTLQMSEQILKRLDSGSCIHGLASLPRPTYVSEKYYDSANCYGGNTGDSAVTMGRIGWADATARRVVGDLKTFENVLLNPILNLLNKNTWLYERYTCQSQPTHNPFYIEYPEMVVMLLREIAYGIRISLLEVVIDPWISSRFTWDFGNLYVQYSQIYLIIRAPGDGSQKAFTISGLVPTSKYLVSYRSGSNQNTIIARTDGQGLLSFKSPTGPSWVTEILKE
eukprot:TRINITY_DN8197_c0_g1_i1.p1 TRINITY_DN8197_c0_g1~~TRINITY_DN8197_c0_g1_i1.p1  ORF type:complete len:770 (-),score=131.23 TRINITY_DN8197_c0_g1_i1:4-2313(-)